MSECFVVKGGDASLSHSGVGVFKHVRHIHKPVNRA